MRTRPLSIRYIASPLSPCLKRRVFCGTFLIGKQVAQLRGRLIVEGSKERHRTKRLERHLSSGL